jgi:epoxide hydrolase-like predicted phosphatase
MIKAILFDIGGVLIRTTDRRPRAMLADAFGYTYEQLDELVFNGAEGHAAQRGEKTMTEQWEYVRRQLNARPDEIETIRHTFFSGDTLDADLLTLIRQLQPRYTLGIITNAFDDVRHALTHQFRIAHLFHHIIVSAEEGIMKPDPRIYQTALDRCGVQPGETVFIDDFPHNVQAARGLGIHAIWHRSAPQTIAELTALLA